MRVRFDRFELDSDLRLLMDGAQPVHVSPKALRLLEILIESRPRPLSKQELTDTIWADTFVDESNLAGLITEIRGALGDDARHPRFVRTVHTFGYGFCGEVSTSLGGAPVAVLLVRAIPPAEGRDHRQTLAGDLCFRVEPERHRERASPCTRGRRSRATFHPYRPGIWVRVLLGRAGER